MPVHPRTRSRIAALNNEKIDENLRLIDPLGYLDFIALMNAAALVLTDSGGVQEETTYLGVPCLTARPNTERPLTILEGTNQLVSSDYGELLKKMRESLSLQRGKAKRPKFWDGHAARRITDLMLKL